ncbi:unnamed protein product [Protopolystoma xenopodis]|uniref:Uncharacterized protein n=1 Tax=Protopolystoma xenopodis TaxID=117903 RepID=A0A3S4ZEP3_9PLAT|nr:unnamed protein product [Protopolystoma xenopodis]
MQRIQNELKCLAFPDSQLGSGNFSINHSVRISFTAGTTAGRLLGIGLREISASDIDAKFKANENSNVSIQDRESSTVDDSDDCSKSKKSVGLNKAYGNDSFCEEPVCNSILVHFTLTGFTSPGPSSDWIVTAARFTEMLLSEDRPLAGPGSVVMHWRTEWHRQEVSVFLVRKKRAV